MRALTVLKEETRAFDLRYWATQKALLPLPVGVGGRVRACAYRMAGFNIGRHCLFQGPLKISGDLHKRHLLSVGNYSNFNTDVLLNLGAEIKIGEYVGVGHEVMILTQTHSIGRHGRRWGIETNMPVIIEDGVWIGARAMILPGVVIGAGSIIGAAALVNKDVPPNTMFAGTPARKIMDLGR